MIEKKPPHSFVGHQKKKFLKYSFYVLRVFQEFVLYHILHPVWQCLFCGTSQRSKPELATATIQC